MTHYTVIISSGDDQAETVVSVDSVAGEPRVTEVAVRSRTGGIVALHQMPDIDLQLLLRALWPSGEPGAADKESAKAEAGPANAKAEAEPAKTKANAKAKAQPERTPKTGRRRVSAQQPVVRAGRVYRKMPDDLAEVYAERGTVVAVAKHYGVPRHTAQGWVGRLRASSAASE